MVGRVAVVRRSPAEAFVGDDVTVDLVVSNQARGTELSMLVRDPHIAPATAMIPSIRPGETVTVRTRRRASRRGVVDGGAIQVASSAPFGVAEARRVVRADGR